MMNSEQLFYADLIEKVFSEGEIEARRDQIEKLSAYMYEILELNKEINLTAITEPREFVIKHYVDSLAINGDGEFLVSTKVLDLGTGAGFPGMPLAIMNPDKEFILVDSLAKRLKIIDELALSIGINNIKTVHGRAEGIGRNKDFRDGFDMVVSRAVADLSVLAEYALPLVRNGGWFFAYKGPSAKEEVERGKSAIFLLKGKLDSIEEKNVLGTQHNIVKIIKVASTPKAYPRKAGTPSKNPL